MKKEYFSTVHFLVENNLGEILDSYLNMYGQNINFDLNSLDLAGIIINSFQQDNDISQIFMRNIFTQKVTLLVKKIVDNLDDLNNIYSQFKDNDSEREHKKKDLYQLFQLACNKKDELLFDFLLENFFMDLFDSIQLLYFSPSRVNIGSQLEQILNKHIQNHIDLNSFIEEII